MLSFWQGIVAPTGVQRLGSRKSKRRVKTQDTRVLVRLREERQGPENQRYFKVQSNLLWTEFSPQVTGVPRDGEEKHATPVLKTENRSSTELRVMTPRKSALIAARDGASIVSPRRTNQDMADGIHEIWILGEGLRARAWAEGAGRGLMAVSSVHRKD